MNKMIVSTEHKEELIDITHKLKRYVTELGVEDGVLIVYVPHTTAAITINENADPDVKTDMLTIMDTMIPYDNGYLHWEGNSSSHMKASMLGYSETIFIVDGQLALGRWQGVYFYEGDGPRERYIYLKILK